MIAWRGDMALIFELCGASAADAVAAAFPGVALYIPKVWRPDCSIALVGETIGTALCAEFGGDTIYVPSSRRCREDILQDIDALIEKQLKLREIAAHLGVTESWIMRVRARGQRRKIRNIPDPRQQNLF